MWWAFLPCSPCLPDRKQATPVVLEKAEDENRQCQYSLDYVQDGELISYVLNPYLEHLSDLGHLYVKEQKECDVQAECGTLVGKLPTF